MNTPVLEYVSRAEKAITAARPRRKVLARRRIAAIVLLTILALCAGIAPLVNAAPTPPKVATRSDCPAVAGIFLPGTWETNSTADQSVPVGLLGPVATELARRFGTEFAFQFPGYAASAFDKLPYGDSKATGVTAVRNALSEVGSRCSATKFVLAGYSQGADAVGDVVASIGCSGDPLAADRILAVGLVADPHQGTAGGKLVGPTVAGDGIAGTRSSGFCGLSAVTAEICAPDDRYCATDAVQHPIIAGLGRILSQPTSTAASGRDSADALPQSLAESLESNFSPSSLTELPAAVQSLAAQAHATQPDTEIVQLAVEALNSALGQLAGLPARAANIPDAVRQSAGEHSDSPDELAGVVLDAIGRADLPAALEALSIIGRHPAGTDSHGTNLRAATDQLLAAIAPVSDVLAGRPAQTLDATARVLSVMKPSLLVDQVANVVSNAIRFAGNIPDLLEIAHRITTELLDLGVDPGTKARQLHELFGRVNNQFAPLMQMAAGVDLHTIARVVGLIPDPSGAAQLISVLVDLLGNVDIQGVADQVGRLQENLWQIAEAIAAGADPLDIGTRVLNLAPTLLGFAGFVVDALTGWSTSTDRTPKTDALTAAKQLTGTMAANGASALTTLASEGLSAATFFASGAHQSYDRYVVDDQGRSAVSWLTDWFTNRIRSIGVLS
ncbi:cutinase family protein [Nocardia aurantia]|uniref:Cutinase n=1 Tax=Nocardia aurantia TaxID=2585199 RepID=A0A7K0DT17_9NOCA|nr:cutinase family protein [Nocardia aurantia]MQY28915.1 hypothetical protein [Nocardia aurantia]